MSNGIIEKVISYGNGSAKESIVNICNNTICAVYYISDPYPEGKDICVDIINKSKGENTPVAMIEDYRGFNSFEFIENQIPRSQDLTKNNRNESEFALKVDLKALAASPNALTDTISALQYWRADKSTCLQNHLYQILLPTCLGKREKMVQFQLKVNQPRCRSSTFGLSTKLEKRYLNYRKKINISNKSSRLTA